MSWATLTVTQIVCLVGLFPVVGTISMGSAQSHTIPKSVLELPRFTISAESYLQLMQLMRAVNERIRNFRK